MYVTPDVLGSKLLNAFTDNVSEGHSLYTDSMFKTGALTFSVTVTLALSTSFKQPFGDFTINVYSIGDVANGVLATVEDVVEPSLHR